MRFVAPKMIYSGYNNCTFGDTGGDSFGLIMDDQDESHASNLAEPGYQGSTVVECSGSIHG